MTSEHKNNGFDENAAEEWNKAIEIIGEFPEIGVALNLTHSALEAAAHIPPDGKFSNVTAPLAAFSRAFHDIQGALTLCERHLYPQALALMRSVYEAASIGRTMAKSSLKIADQWMAGEWQPDKKARQFVANVMYADAEPNDREEAVDAYADSYSLLSQWAHVTTTSALDPYVKESEDGYELLLFPELDEQKLRFTLRTILLQAIFLAYAIRNSAAGLEAWDPAWLQTLDELGERVIGPTAQDLKLDYKEIEKRRQTMVNILRNSSEHKRAMRQDPDSFTNLLRESDHRIE